MKINEKNTINWKWSKEGFMGVFRWKKEKDKMVQLYYALKNKTK